MTLRIAEAEELSPVAAESAVNHEDTFKDSGDLTSEIRDELLDQAAWGPVLEDYAQTLGLAVSMADAEGHNLGVCHNPQPVWQMVDSARRAGAKPCASSFFLDSMEPCQSVPAALSTGLLEVTREESGLVHLAVPLTLGRYRLGAVVAGQVFDQYPDPLKLQRLAKHVGISAQDLWQRARQQPPIRTATLKVYGQMLLTFGHAFIRQRYAAILDRKLARSNLRLRLLVDGIEGHALFTVDRAGLVTSWNNGAQRLFGYTESEVIGQGYSRFFIPEDIEAGAPQKLLQLPGSIANVPAGSVLDWRWQVRKDGTRFFAEGSITALGIGNSLEFGRLAIDATERRSVEQAMRHKQKLESIGVLASGIAHDFNNLLTSILGGVSFAKDSLAPDHPAYPWLSVAEEASEKAADLANQLLAYGGKGKFLVTRFDLSQMVRHMLKLLQATIPKTVDLQLTFAPDLPCIEADASQIQQIVMNLVINGAESIGPEGGTLTITTGLTAPDKRCTTGTNEVYMEVRDSGSGMTEATQARIFDPFFTTKFKGRGLGLAAVAGIVRGHQGGLQVESAVGKGSTFRVCFPGVVALAEAPAEKLPERQEITEAPPAAAAEHKPAGTILVVDDEPGLRKIARAILKHAGYNVLVAQDGREGVEIFRKHADSITAILLDMTMPVMSGADAFLLMRAIRPSVPIVVSTGYTEVATRELFGKGAKVGFVQKPYTAARLCERIRTTSEIAEQLPR